MLIFFDQLDPKKVLINRLGNDKQFINPNASNK